MVFGDLREVGTREAPFLRKRPDNIRETVVVVTIR